MHLSLEKSQLKSTPSSFYEVGVNFTAIIIIIIIIIILTPSRMFR